MNRRSELEKVMIKKMQTNHFLIEIVDYGVRVTVLDDINVNPLVLTSAEWAELCRICHRIALFEQSN